MLAQDPSLNCIEDFLAQGRIAMVGISRSSARTALPMAASSPRSRGIRGRSLMLYDFRSQRWSKWLTEPGNIAFPTWSRDGRYIYFDNFLTDHPTARRVKPGDTHSEELFSWSDLRRFSGTPAGTWGGLAPDDSRLYSEDLSVRETYSLQLQRP
jgi:dipeptidyl aminopeptidase/acylaminoacyl peptidase